jgi:hypothetical protein
MLTNGSHSSIRPCSMVYRTNSAVDRHAGGTDRRSRTVTVSCFDHTYPCFRSRLAATW